MKQPESDPPIRFRFWRFWPAWLSALVYGLWQVVTQGLPAVQAGKELTEPPAKGVSNVHIETTIAPGRVLAPAPSVPPTYRTVGPRAISLGVSREHVVALLGAPVTRESCDALDGTLSDIYSFPDRYLQLVYDTTGSLRFYAVTLRTRQGASAPPELAVPILERPLGMFDFRAADSALSGPTVLEHIASAKLFVYTEAFESGNPGNYRTLYLAYNHAGADLTPTGTVVSNPDTPADSQSARSNFPNTFAVGGGMTADPLAQFGEHCAIGVDYFSARTLPDNLGEVRFDPHAFW